MCCGLPQQTRLLLRLEYGGKSSSVACTSRCEESITPVEQRQDVCRVDLSRPLPPG